MQPRPPWAGAAYRPRDRRLRLRLRSLGPRIQVRIDEEQQQGGIAVSRHLSILIPGEPALRGLETITPLSVQVSVQPQGRAAAIYLLTLATNWGHPATIYADEAGAARDLTAEWRALTHMPSELERGARRDAAGFRLTPLTIADLERIASG